MAVNRQSCHCLFHLTANKLYTDGHMPSAKPLKRFPFLDPNVEYVTSSKLRLLNMKVLRSLRKPMIVTTREKGPCAVILSYETYMSMQTVIMSGIGPMLERVCGEGE
jgi:hypothetical protein